jgi:ATP-binding cassette, subfamily B (MDR/TAP), member 1
MAASVRQANRIRNMYLNHALHQDITFFASESNSGAILQGISTDVQLVQVAISDKIGLFIQVRK